MSLKKMSNYFLPLTLFYVKDEGNEIQCGLWMISQIVIYRDQ